MPDTTDKDIEPVAGDKTVVYLLGVVAVLLAVIVALVVIRSQSAAPGTADTAATTGMPSGATSNPGMGQSTGAFDAKTATKVPAGQQPEAYVKAYYAAILAKKWDEAFKMQPAASKTGTVKDFQATQEMYGMKSFKIVSAEVKGDTATVVVEQDLGTNGQWGASWILVKNGSDWLVKERQVSMGATK